MTIYDNGNRNDNDNDHMRGIPQPLTQKNAYLYFDATIPIATRIVLIYADNTTTIYQQRATATTATSNEQHNDDLPATATVAQHESDV